MRRRWLRGNAPQLHRQCLASGLHPTAPFFLFHVRFWSLTSTKSSSSRHKSRDWDWTISLTTTTAPSFQGEWGSMFHIHINVGMHTTSEDHVHILLHVISSCDGVLSFPPVFEPLHIYTPLLQLSVVPTSGSTVWATLWNILCLYLYLGLTLHRFLMFLLVSLEVIHNIAKKKCFTGAKQCSGPLLFLRHSFYF